MEIHYESCRDIRALFNQPHNGFALNTSVTVLNVLELL